MDRRKAVFTTVVWIFTLMIMALIIKFSQNTITQNIRVARSTIAAQDLNRFEENAKPYTVSLLSDGKPVLLQIKRIPTSDIYHDTLETLLAAPPKAYSTAIDPRTRLIGCTLSGRTLAVDLTVSFLESEDLKMAKQQVEQTLLNLDEVDSVILLVEGKPLSDTAPVR